MSVDTNEVLDSLSDLGIELWVEGDQLRYRAPKGALTAELRSKLRRHKAELLEALQAYGSNERNAVQQVVQTEGVQTPQFVQATTERRAGQSKSKFSLFDEKRAKAAALPQQDQPSHPYLRYVSPYRGYLFSQMELGKRYVRGEGCSLYDEHGRQYLDFVAQYGALPFGFNPPEIWQAMLAVREQGAPSFVNPSLMDAGGELAQRLIEIAPPGLRYVAFANSGTEAVEAALKLCRAATGRPAVLATKNGFHGLTLGSMSATGHRIYQQGFGAPVPGFDHIPYGDLDALRSTLKARKDYYAAFIVEPIQGGGGIVDPPPDYLAEAQTICREAGTLFVIDEVQTGLGRTGTLWACSKDEITPDVMTIAKALGGGLMPIGACLYSEQAYTQDFDLRHSSTFAGNTLACRAGLATLEAIERDDYALLRQVARNGEYLKEQLHELQRRFPDLIASVRGRGYLLGVEFNLDGLLDEHCMLSCLQQKNFLIPLIVGYLLNVEHIRVASSFSSGTVLRIEPPLIAGKEECDKFLGALERALDLIDRRESGMLMRFLVGEPEQIHIKPGSASRDNQQPKRLKIAWPTTEASSSPGDGRFAFIVHLLSVRDYVDFDPSLAIFNDKQLAILKDRMVNFLDPFPLGSLTVQSVTGQQAHGEFIMVPYTAEDLLQMPGEQSLAEIELAVEIAQERGARVVGLGGFTSIATHGGLSITGEQLPQLTSGNSYTVVAAKQAIQVAARQRGLSLADSSVAVVGGAGIIGQALAVLLSEEFARLILIGNPKFPQRSRSRLMEVAAIALQHLWELRRAGRQFAHSTLGTQLDLLASTFPSDPQPADFLRLAGEIESRRGAIVIATDHDSERALRDADVVVSATNSTETFISGRQLKQNAIVCDVSRPFNVCEDVKRTRPDVLVIEGGLVRVPGDPDFRILGGKQKGVIVACIAETMLLALEQRHDLDGLCGTLTLSTIEELERIGERHGFRVTLDGTT